MGVSGVSECVPVLPPCPCAPTISLCGGAALAPNGDGRAESCAKKDDGASAYFFLRFFFFLTNLLF